MADNMKGIVKAVCTSPAKGTEKKPVAEAFFIVGHGIEGTRTRANGTDR